MYYTLPETIARKLKDVPDKPGCYLMRNRQGRIIYVGKALSLRKRVRSYFRAATMRRADPKLRSLVHSAADLEWLVTRTEAEAILTEGRLIKEYRPRYNVSFKDDKRFLLIRVNPADACPQLKAVRIQRDDSAHYFGPYPSSRAARAAIEFADRAFGLRRCAPAAPGPEDHRHCIDDIVRFCSAPCIGKISPEEYRGRIDEACAFLRGERPRHIAALREAMNLAAQKMDFESAASLRDLLLLLEEATRRRIRMPATAAMKADAAAAGLLALQQALNLPRPPGFIEGFDISNISGTLAVASMVCAVDGVPNRARYRRFRIQTVTGSDDPAMMAEVIRRRYQRLTREGGAMPDLVLVDGGLTQQRAAAAELAALGVKHPPVIGLAKRFEELHTAAGDQPVRLDPESPALLILRRLRDEAHRFALAYHHRLRARKIRESVLDDIPGIGANRKEELLRRFGSIARLRSAAVEQIAEVPGVGAALAARIKQALTSQPG